MFRSCGEDAIRKKKMIYRWTGNKGWDGVQRWAVSRRRTPLLGGREGLCPNHYFFHKGGATVNLEKRAKEVGQGREETWKLYEIATEFPESAEPEQGLQGLTAECLGVKGSGGDTPPEWRISPGAIGILSLTAGEGDSTLHNDELTQHIFKLWFCH